MKTRRFIDRVKVKVVAGKGGDGCASFRREKYVPQGGPDGGDGGHGGDVVFCGSKDIDSLVALYFEPLVRAEHGGDGKGQRCFGRNGADAVVLVPCGTEVRDFISGELRADIVADGQREVIAAGGKGGLGNVHFKSATHQAPTERTLGEEGEELELQLELKTIADVGLIGFPSAGKSSLLAALTAARPKVANYPFTTMNPVIGTVVYSNYDQLRVADIPGIIEGASDGAGLGLQFLRHITRAPVLAYVIDMAGSEAREPWDDYTTLRHELQTYDPALLERPAIVVANKMDLPDAVEKLAQFREKFDVEIAEISATEEVGIAELSQRLRALAQRGDVEGQRNVCGGMKAAD
ncbi:MAG: GTPase ObgE [Lentisphaerae bacterium]|nr:GTPase ObgE [Lentisphaerota bacterium]